MNAKRVRQIDAMPRWPFVLLFLGIAAVASSARVGVLEIPSAFAHGGNPDHIDLIIGPGRSDIVTSQPFDASPYVSGGSESSTPGTLSSSYADDDCDYNGDIDFCHHQGWPNADWSIDIDSHPATGDDDVYLSVVDDPYAVEVTNYIYAIEPMCDSGNPAGYKVAVEVWARFISGTWRPIGIVTYEHITPAVSLYGWYWPGTKVGDATEYSYYSESCFTGSHVHMDAYTYGHFAQWTSNTLNNTSVSYSSWYASTTPIGFLGGSNNNQGADGRWGRWVGW